MYSIDSWQHAFLPEICKQSGIVPNVFFQIWKGHKQPEVIGVAGAVSEIEGIGHHGVSISVAESSLRERQ